MAVLAPTRINEFIADHTGQVEGIIEFAVGYLQVLLHPARGSRHDRGSGCHEIVSCRSPHAPAQTALALGLHRRQTELSSRSDAELAVLFQVVAEALAGAKPGSPERRTVIASLQNISQARAERQRECRVPGF